MNAIATYRKALQMYKEQTAVARQPSLVAPDALAYCNLVHCLQMVCDWSKRDAHFASVRRIIDAQLEVGVLGATASRGMQTKRVVSLKKNKLFAGLFKFLGARRSRVPTG